MKKVTIITLTIITALLFNSCGNAELTSAEMNNLVIDYNGGKGYFAGISIGDDWNEIKKNYAKDWEVSEDGGLTKKWDFYNYIFISLTLDEMNKVKAMNMNFEVSIENIPELMEIDNLLQLKYNLNYKPNGEQSWQLENPEGYTINKTYTDKLGKPKTNAALRIRVEKF